MTKKPKTPFELAAERAQEVRIELAAIMNQLNREQHEMYEDSDIGSAWGER